ncbi:MAG: hypothetical protein IIA92_12190 [Chloroflexi bacterium]|nr:hypothetical protein [Chloroflexota bacterium]
MWLLRPAHKHIGQDTLSEHLDGRLRGRPLERVERQLGECDACRQDLAELQATVAMMRQLPMETHHRSFVMTAPPPEPARARPNLALRAPNWVYAGAASVAALALAITVSLDATGGLSSGPLRRDVEVTALVPTAASEQVTITSGSATESATESALEPVEETAPPPLAAVAPAAATADQPVQEEPSGEGTAAFAAAAAPMATPAPVVAPDTATQDSGVTLAESAGVEPGPTDVVPDGGQALGTRSTPGAGDISSVENQTAKSLPIEAPIPISERAEPELFEEGADRDTSIWWRVFEATAGALAVVFLAGLVLRRRANRRDFA